MLIEQLKKLQEGSSQAGGLRACEIGMTAA